MDKRKGQALSLLRNMPESSLRCSHSFTIFFQQFVELKGSVFKKFDKNNLFQVSCSDVRERFHLFALLFIVVVQTMKEYGWREGQLHRAHLFSWKMYLEQWFLTFGSWQPTIQNDL